MDQFFSEVTPDSDPQSGQPFHLGRFMWELFQTVLLSVLLFLAINAVSTRIRVQSISMQPTLYERDLVLVSKLAYRFGEPARTDIVVFNPPVDSAVEPYIKRVIGLPGDRVQISNQQVSVNGAVLEEAYIAAEPQYTGEWIIPEGHLFVLGDNRNNSSDSHNWGMVPVDNVIGKAEFVYWPVQHWQLLTSPVPAAAGP